MSQKMDHVFDLAVLGAVLKIETVGFVFAFKTNRSRGSRTITTACMAPLTLGVDKYIWYGSFCLKSHRIFKFSRFPRLDELKETLNLIYYTL